MQTNEARQLTEHYESQARIEREKQIYVRKRKVGWITKGEKALLTIFCILLLCAAYYVISFASATYSLNKDVQGLEQQINQKEIANDGLTFEVKELSKPERIIKIAKENGFKTQNSKVKQAMKSMD